MAFGQKTGAVELQAQAAFTAGLTDNGGGTADQTVASMAAAVTITDSSGLDGTHDDTIGATAAIVTLTDSTGLDGTHNDTVAAITNIDLLVDSTTGAADDTIADVSAALATATVAAEAALNSAVTTRLGVLNVNFKNVVDQVIAQRTANTVLSQNQSDLAQKVIELVTREGVTAQNVSDLAQKMIELVAWQTTMQNNMKEHTTLIESMRSKLVTAGIMKAS